MALIEYRINVDSSGNATVIQDVREIGPGDQIRFVANNTTTVIKYDGASPFDSPPNPPVASPAAGVGPVSGQIFLVPMAGANPPQALKVTNPISNAPTRFVPEFQEARKTFHFQCGQGDSTNFSPWGGGGGHTSSGGSR
jgi:hypothetical protein